MHKTKIKVSPLFFALLTAFLLIDKQGIAGLAILFSFIHEACHFLALLCIKTMPISVTLTPFGIEMELPKSLSTGKKIFVLTAGFTANFFVGMLLIFLDYHLYGYISVLIGIFTALPVPSTDGGGVLAAFTEEFYPEKAHRITAVISLIFSAFTVFLLCTAAIATKNAFLTVPIVYILIMALKKPK